MNQTRVVAQLTNIRGARRCSATTRAGGSCQCPAIRDRTRCRLHGGKSPGAPRGAGNGNYKGGEFTVEAKEERQWLRSIVRTYGRVDKT
ncbi:HGGxSTG domain-containing protein [Tardiphaga sp. 839_C3_N1_4]|uniref:HGGxSTG domain-containing protein n=1 Tax=Tardiphaga sp. 839_C3_N1_4 TaxID=3240761 RepID=UPI003F29D846